MISVFDITKVRSFSQILSNFSLNFRPTLHWNDKKIRTKSLDILMKPKFIFTTILESWDKKNCQTLKTVSQKILLIWNKLSQNQPQFFSDFLYDFSLRHNLRIKGYNERQIIDWDINAIVSYFEMDWSKKCFLSFQFCVMLIEFSISSNFFVIFL